jgi:hypothetical protein
VLHQTNRLGLDALPCGRELIDLRVVGVEIRALAMFVIKRSISRSSSPLRRCRCFSRSPLPSPSAGARRCRCDSEIASGLASSSRKPSNTRVSIAGRDTLQPLLQTPLSRNAEHYMR